MKKLLILLAAAVMMSCEKDNSKGSIDPNVNLEIKGIASTKLDYKLSDVEIVKRAYMMIADTGSMAMLDFNKDTINGKFIVGSHFIFIEGELHDQLISSENIIWVTLDDKLERIQDTLAYIPRATMRQAENAIYEAYAAEDYDLCMELLRTAWEFVPTTNEEYRQMLIDGTN